MTRTRTHNLALGKNFLGPIFRGPAWQALPGELGPGSGAHLSWLPWPPCARQAPEAPMMPQMIQVAIKKITAPATPNNREVFMTDHGSTRVKRNRALRVRLGARAG